MRIKRIAIECYEMALTTRQLRQGAVITITDQTGNSGVGEIAPLPNVSSETLGESLQQLHEKHQEIKEIEWTADNCLQELEKLELLPSLVFGLESALLSLLKPLLEHAVLTSALLMGSSNEIMKQAALKDAQGYTSAKLKVNNLTFKEASSIIHQLKNTFHLRIDVNKAWKTSESLHFFEQFSLNTFDYVEEPFQDANDLKLFPHPLAVDESFPKNLSLNQLEALPTLKALIYKPTIQGGLLKCLPLHEWTKKRGIELILSSGFESAIGLQSIASMAHRLSLSSPLGLGTYDYFEAYMQKNALQFFHPFVRIFPTLPCVYS